jgi:ion channel POLLUX/CASTOR
MSSTYTFYQRFRYFFDNTMSKGTIALIAWLALVSFLLIWVAGLFLHLFGVVPEGETETFSIWEGTWQSLLRTLDAGTGAGDSGFTFRLVSIMVTMAGIFIISTLIGVISGGLESTIDELRKGKSLVIEKNHTIILGWSSKVFTLISEYSLANQSNKGGIVVILANRDKVEMEDDIRQHLPDLKGTKVICRSGSTHDIDDLQIVNPSQSKAIIILSAEEGNADAQTIKSILALTNINKSNGKPYHIVAEIRSHRNLEVAKMVGGDQVEMVFPDDITARIMVQASRQTGLSLVYANLMDFDDSEMYFTDAASFAGQTYKQTLLSFEQCAVMGIKNAANIVMLNPDANYLIQPKDQLVLIAEDDSTIKANKSIGVSVGEIITLDNQSRPAEKSLLLGWNHRAITIITEMDNYAAPNSYLKVVSSFEDKDNIMETLAPNLKNIKLEFVHADTTDRHIIDALNLPQYDYILLLCYQNEMELQDADAETLITLLHLRRICDAERAKTGKSINIVSEMLDLRNCTLAELTRADDFIVSDKLISLLTTQVAENKHLMQVFSDLFSADGSEIYLKPAKNYVKTGITNNFYAVVESASNRNETAIGYRLMHQANDNSNSFGIYINPDKSKPIQFNDNDLVIILSEN